MNTKKPIGRPRKPKPFETKAIHANVPVEVHAKLSKIARSFNRTIDAQVCRLITNFIVVYERRHGEIDLDSDDESGEE